MKPWFRLFFLWPIVVIWRAWSITEWLNEIFTMFCRTSTKLHPTGHPFSRWAVPLSYFFILYFFWVYFQCEIRKKKLNWSWLLLLRPVFLKLGVGTHLCVANILQCVAKKKSLKKLKIWNKPNGAYKQIKMNKNCIFLV